MKGNYKDVDRHNANLWRYVMSGDMKLRWKKIVVRRMIEMILLKLSRDYDGDENYERRPSVFTNVMEEVKVAETSTA